MNNALKQDLESVSFPPDDGKGKWQIGIGSREDRAAKGHETRKVPLGEDQENRAVIFRVRKEVAEAAEA
ncbi:MAG: hypothetical protein ABIH35_00570 [Patescibacteria group bacterium]